MAGLAAELKGLFDPAALEVVGLTREWERLSAGLTRDGADLARMNAKGKASVSLLVHERGLCAFLDDPRADEEQSLEEDLASTRDLVISRNLSFGPGGPNGAKTAGLLGVLEAVRMVGLSAYTGVHGGWRHAHATAASHPQTCAHGCRGR